MYINDVIRRVRDFKPNEYHNSELYIFCDEVSSMLSIEDRPSYKERIIPISSDGTLLLPEGVKFENVVNVFCNGVELRKEDMRTFGRRTVKLTSNSAPANTATVVYIVPYSPIRMPKYTGKVIIDKENSKLYIDSCDFVNGDSLVLEADDVVIQGIPVYDILYDYDKTRFELSTTSFALKDIPESEYENATLTRTVTEETVCDAPYDSMYIDYLIAKICLYQGDSREYNQYMTSFNSKLSAYREWLVGKMPAKKYRLKNWW